MCVCGGCVCVCVCAYYVYFKGFIALIYIQATERSLQEHLYIYIYIRWSLNKFPDFFRMGTFIDSTRMKP